MMPLKYVAFLLVSSALFGQAPLEPQSMLFEAERIAKTYQLEVAKAPPPSPCPQTQKSLDAASVWFTIDLYEMAALDGQTVLGSLGSEDLWDYLREMGVQAVHLKGLKRGGSQRTGFGVDPRWGSEKEWQRIALNAQRTGIALIGDLLGSSTGWSADFYLALKNYGEYPGLYHLIEVPEEDWGFLPSAPTGHLMANVPWLKLQELHRRGYVPEQFSPYVKESRWNATAAIQGADGTLRRWIFLKENRADPVIDWLDSSFAGIRLASADALDSVYRLGQNIVQLDAKIGANAKETLALWVRKLGAFSAQEMDEGLEALKGVRADLALDTLTRSALLHALIAQDAEALRLMYRLFLEEGIETKRLVHVLQPFDRYACDYAELICSAKKKFLYYDEQLTGEALRYRLLKEDMAALGGDKVPLCTWTGYCASALGIKDFEQHASAIADAHSLLAFFYAMQPGVFSFSVSDLLGALPHQMNSLNLMGANAATLYSCLPNQFKNCRSFALRMKQMLQVRRDRALESGELAAVPCANNKGALLLLHRMRNTGFLQLLAINFGRAAARETLEMSGLRQTTAINLMTGHFENKSLESASFTIDLPPLSGKAILFQPKYYD